MVIVGYRDVFIFVMTFGLFTMMLQCGFVFYMN